MLSWVIVDRAQCRSINRDDRDLEELSRRTRNDVAKLSDAQPAYERAEPKWEAIERYARMMQVARPEIPSEAAGSMCTYAHMPVPTPRSSVRRLGTPTETSSDLRKRQNGHVRRCIRISLDSCLGRPFRLGSTRCVRSRPELFGRPRLPILDHG